jgi:hypothetical protein
METAKRNVQTNVSTENELSFKAKPLPKITAAAAKNSVLGRAADIQVFIFDMFC